MENKEFVPYDIALELKQLEFDEPCFAWYVSKDYGVEIGMVIKSDLIKEAILAPTFSQAFRFFREKHNLYSVCFPELDKWVIEIKELKGFEGNPAVIGYPDLEYTSYEEAELACLIKLIEIVK